MQTAVGFNNSDFISANDPNDPHTFVTEFSQKVYEHYMDYEIECPSKTRELCTLLRGVGSNDTVIIRINSEGGRFDYASQIINSIWECQGTVISVIEQKCFSAATMIFLACNQWRVTEFAEMMIHMASYGMVGKAHEIESRFFATKKRLEQAVRSLYKDFLTEDEIEEVIRGGDIYLTPEEILSRLEAVAEIRKKRQEGNSDGCEEKAD